MNALVLMLIPATLGVDFGWERQPDNSIEYILQIEPEAIGAMQTGTELVSSLPPSLRNIKDYRIRVGRDPLPNKNVIPPEFNTVAANNYVGGGNYAGSMSGTGMTTVPTSTSGFPLQTTPSGYPPNTNNQYLASTQPTPTPFPSGTNPNNPYAAATTQPNYNTAGYNATPGYNTNPNYNTAPNYSTTGYNATPNYNPATNPAGYNQPNPGYQQPNNNYQYPPPGYQQPQQPYGQQQPQYLAQNTAPALYGPGLGDPRAFGAAKPNIADPMTPLANGNYAGANTGAYPAGTQFTQPGATPAGSFSGTLPPPPGTYPNNFTPGTLPPANGQPGATIAANTTGQAPATTNTSATDPHQQTTAAKVEPVSAATSFVWLFVFLFLSIGANICFGYANFNLRERCRILMVDRAAY